MEKQIKVLCVDDSPDIVELYCTLLNNEPDIECVGTLLSTDKLVDEVCRIEPDVVLLDLTMPGSDPLGAVDAIASVLKKTRIVFCSGYDDETTLQKISQTDAWGLVGKHKPVSEIFEAIRTVVAGEKYFPSETKSL